MKKGISVILIAILLVTFAACGNDNTPSSGTSAPEPPSESSAASAPESASASISVAESGEPTSPSTSDQDNDLLHQIDALHQQLDTTRLPLQEYDYWFSTDSDSLAELPTQLILDIPEAYYYAQTIRNYLFHNSNILSDFEDIESMPGVGVIKTAIYHTTPIQWHWSTYGGAENGYDGPYDNHVLSALIKNEAEQGRGLTDLYYEDDVQDTIKRMFGDIEEINYYNGGEPYIYYARDKVYGRIGDFGGPVWHYPILTAMEPAADGMVCEVVLVSALDKETPLTPILGDEELTADNFELATAHSAKYEYTFANGADGNPVLISLITLREETVKP
jgi:hypothetical protein